MGIYLNYTLEQNFNWAIKIGLISLGYFAKEYYKYNKATEGH